MTGSRRSAASRSVVQQLRRRLELFRRFVVWLSIWFDIDAAVPIVYFCSMIAVPCLLLLYDAFFPPILPIPHLLHIIKMTSKVLFTLLSSISTAAVAQNCTKLFSSSSENTADNTVPQENERRYCSKDIPRYGCDEGQSCVKLFGETFYTCQGGNAKSKTSQETHCFDKEILDFMERNGFPGASVAVLKNGGEVAYSQGYGNQDMGRNSRKFMPWTPSRVASISKTVTVLAVLRLVEQGKVNLQDKVFSLDDGDGILKVSRVDDPRVFDITVEHLLRHQGGWDEVSRGGSGISDPFFALFYYGDIILNDDRTDIVCFSSFDSAEECGRTGEDWMKEIAEKLGKENGPFEREELIDYMVQYQPLSYAPGTKSFYSNLGFSILASVLEEKTGMPYEAAVNELYLQPACVDEQEMYQGKTLSPSDDTVEPQYYSDLLYQSVFNFSELVPGPYSFYMEPKAAEGGWVASAQQLLQMISYAMEPYCASDEDDDSQHQCLLSASIMNMAKNVTFMPAFGMEFGMALSSGFFPGDFWNGGNLDGSQAMLYMSGDWAWAFVSNRNDDPGNEAFYNAFTDAIECVESWNASFPNLPTASEEAENINPENSSSNVTEEQEAGNGGSTSNAGIKKFALPKIAAVVATLFISNFSLG